MNLGTRRVHSLLENSYVSFFGAVASIVSLAWFAYLEMHPSPWTIFGVISLPITFLFFLVVAIYSIRVRQQNIQFRNFIAILHTVNHNYRDALSAVFKHLSQHISEVEYSNYVKEIERKTLKSACQKIAKVYEAFGHCTCVVTIKLIGREEEKIFCETLERSEVICQRDFLQPRKFNINTGENTAFDKARMYVPGKISHFHSYDLTAEKDYHNQRDHWFDFYTSTIVVPIRSLNPDKIGSMDGHDEIGYLCLDTLSTNRLNNTWHIELLASFADQMYNFINLMRGRYSLGRAVVTEKAPSGSNQPLAH